MIHKRAFNFGLGMVSTAVLLCYSAASYAETTPAPENWWSKFTYGAQINAGGTWNADNPDDKKNFGRLIDDKSNDLQLNQILLTAGRPIDSASKSFDYGFQLQALYGSDGRITNYLHELQNASGKKENHFDMVQAALLIHAPCITENGFDAQIGQYLSPEGAEAIDPSLNYFYSHSYIFNFGVPYKHTGVLLNIHVNPMVNILAGVDTGVNTSIGAGDNNDSLSFQGGIGLNLMDGKLTSLITSHIGPENPKKAVYNGLLPASVDANSATRALSDITTTWKATDNLTLINDINWVRDDALAAGKPANAFGIAQYAIYKINDTVSFTSRAEFFRDINGAFVFQSGNNIDFLRAENGEPALSSRTVYGGKTSYGALSVGLNIKPNLGISQIQNVVLRPELRYDTSLNGTSPFNDSKDDHMITAAMDIIISF